MIERIPGGIIARDQDGEEHYLEVVPHPAGLISIRDGSAVRVLAPAAALKLCYRLLSSLIGKDQIALDEGGLIEDEGAGGVLSEEQASRLLLSLNQVLGGTVDSNQAPT